MTLYFHHQVVRAEWFHLSFSLRNFFFSALSRNDPLAAVLPNYFYRLGTFVDFGFG